MSTPRPPEFAEALSVIEQPRTGLARARERIAELERRLDEKRPPAPPGFVKANRKKKPANQPKEPRKKHTTNNARKRETPTERIEHSVDNCPDCGRKLKDGWPHSTRQVIDIPFVPYIVREHVAMGRHCGVCRRDHIAKPDLRGEVIGKHRVSIRVMALVAYLKTECRMPISQIRELLRALKKLVEDNPTNSWVAKWADKIRALYDEAVAYRLKQLAYGGGPA